MGEGRILKLFVFLNSLMVIKVMEIFCWYNKEYKLSVVECELIDWNIKYVCIVDEFISFDFVWYFCVIIFVSGMVSGGCVLYYFKILFLNFRNSIVFVGFQVFGIWGDLLINGVELVKIYGDYWLVKVDIYNLDLFLVYGDYKEIFIWFEWGFFELEWVFVIYGEFVVSDLMCWCIWEIFGW